MRSDEEVMLEGKMKMLKRFEKKRERDGLKSRRERSRPLVVREVKPLPQATAEGSGRDQYVTRSESNTWNGEGWLRDSVIESLKGMIWLAGREGV